MLKNKLCQFLIIFIGFPLFLNSLLAQNKTEKLIQNYNNNTSRLSVTAVSPQDSLALIALYDSTDGDNWTDNTNWLSTQVSEWYGVTVSSSNVTELNLSNNNLNGTIPSAIGDLTNLEVLILNNNNLTGSIPAELTNPSNLMKVRLDNNQLSGTFPTDGGDLPNLEYLNLSSNQLADSIPSGFSNLINLEYLYLNNNQLFGSIPNALGNLDSLKYLWLHDNQLSGSIPETLGNIDSLQSLYLSSNQLTDSIPSSLTNLTNLENGQSDLRWNGLYTDSTTLRTFLNNKQWGGDWESTQTIAPNNITTNSMTDTSITLTWTPITYTEQSGGYRIFRSTNSGGLYTEYGMTADKTINSLKVTGLASDMTYYFVIKTQTNPHIDNLNTVVSEPSDEISASTTPVLYPEIDILGNNTSISNADFSPDLSDDTDFGNVAIDDDQKSHTFTIVNNGLIDLNLTDTPKVKITGTDVSDFRVISQPSSPIASNGGTTSFTVQFNPSESGVRIDTISIANNDSDENPYQFAVQGTGASPEMRILGNDIEISDGDATPEPANSLNTDSTDFGNVAVAGETVSHTFTIENTGNANLLLTGTPKVTVDNSVFTVTSQPSSPLAPGASTSFTIKFNPNIFTIGTTTATVSIDNNDSDKDPYDFTIQGTGTAPDINIVGNGTTIVNGDSLPSPIDNTEFGITPVAGGIVSHTFSIENTGNADLVLTGTPKVILTVTDFEVTSQPSSPIPPGGGSSNFTIQFDPSYPGLQIDTVVIASNDPDLENLYTFAIQGTGTAPEIDVLGNSTSISDGDTLPHPGDGTDFGHITVSDDTVYHSFVIKNTGYADLILSGSPRVILSGTHQSDFTVISQPDSLIESEGDTTSFKIQFIPSGTGTRKATVSIANTDLDENPYDFTIQGTGTSPEMDVQGNSLSIPDGDTSPDLTDNTDFGNTAVAGELVSHTFTIKNTGYADLLLTASPRVTITGDHQSDFSVTSQPDSLITAGEGTTTFTVQFDPSEAGPRIALVNIYNNDSDENPYDFTIQGTGTSPEIDVQGNSTSIINKDYNPHPADGTDFGYLTVSSDTIFHTFTIKNTGYADLFLTGSPRVEITGDYESDFTVTSQPDSIVAGGGTTSFTIQFYPINIGLRYTMINIPNTDLDESPYSFTIQGVGTTPEIDIQGNNISIPDNSTSTEPSNNTDFGNVNVFNDSASHTFTIFNTGDGKLILKNYPKVEISGTHQADFTITSQPDSIIPAGKNSSFTVKFKPSGSGTRVAGINIINNDLNENPYDFTIRGTGISNEPEIDILGNGVSISNGDESPSVYDDTDFGDCNVASGTVSHTFTIKNYGNAELNLTGTDDYVELYGYQAPEFRVTSPPISPISPNGGTTTFTIEFDPSTIGYRYTIVTIENDDTDEGTYEFIILGTGVVIVSEQDSLALVALYKNTNGEMEWKRDDYWLQAPVRDWYGVKQNYGVVTSLKLNNNNLIGTLPPEIGNLSNLRKLDLQGNQLTGSLPEELGNLTNLDTLYLNDNQLNDTIPATLGNLVNLKYLYVNNNQLTGDIPSTFGNLTKLIKLDLHNNQLSDSIPSELQYLTDLTFLSLKNNRLCGAIPEELGNLSDLDYLAINGNQLTGPIPSSFTQLTSLSDDKSDIRWNALYTDNETVRTFMNQKQKGHNWQSTQTVAPENFRCGSLTDSSITLYWTPITFTKNTGGYKIFYAEDSSGPYTEFGITEDKTVDSLLVTDLSPEAPYFFVIRTQTNTHPDNKNIVISNQSEEISCLTLQSQDSLALVALYDSTDGDNWTNNTNWLSAPLEDWYGVTVTNGYVTSLELDNNNLNGTIPSEMEKLFKLEIIKLNSNQLTGEIPTFLTKLTSLTDNNSDFRWNALYTEDNTLRSFINSKQEDNDWESTQTVAPENVSCGSATANSITVNWTPIIFTNGSGGYRVFYSTTREGLFTEFGITSNKTTNSMVVTGLDSETKYYFMVRTQTNPHANNNFTVVSNKSEKASKTTQSPTSLQSDDLNIPQTFALLQNHPNPFNPETEITYALPKPDQVTITIYNMIGQPVHTLINSKMPAGYHTITWNGCDNNGHPLPSGIYFYIMQSGSFKQIKKALLMK